MEKWKCEKCGAENEAEVAICACCGEAKQEKKKIRRKVSVFMPERSRPMMLVAALALLVGSVFMIIPGFQLHNYAHVFDFGYFLLTGSGILGAILSFGIAIVFFNVDQEDSRYSSTIFFMVVPFVMGALAITFMNFTGGAVIQGIIGLLATALMIAFPILYRKYDKDMSYVASRVWIGVIGGLFLVNFLYESYGMFASIPEIYKIQEYPAEVKQLLSTMMREYGIALLILPLAPVAHMAGYYFCFKTRYVEM